MRKRRAEEEVDASKFEWGKGKSEERKVDDRSDRRKPAPEAAEEPKKKAPKMKLETSGLLREEALKGEAGVARVYVQSPDSAMPTAKWALYPFKGSEALEVIPLHRQEWYLFGKDREVAHVPTDHLTCSRQHAVIQFRRVTRRNEFGDERVSVVPYLMDLKSSNGTFLNKERIEALRYYELRHQDVLSFASSTREYVLLNTDLAK